LKYNEEISKNTNSITQPYITPAPNSRRRGTGINTQKKEILEETMRRHDKALQMLANM
jgi:hypothetical protein